MPELPPHSCPDCGKRCAMIYGCGWDYDYAFCPCGYSLEFTTSTYPDPDPVDHVPDTGKKIEGQ